MGYIHWSPEWCSVVVGNLAHLLLIVQNEAVMFIPASVAESGRTRISKMRPLIEEL